MTSNPGSLDDMERDAKSGWSSHKCCACGLCLNESEHIHTINHYGLCECIAEHHWDQRAVKKPPEIGSHLCCGHFLWPHKSITKTNWRKFVHKEMDVGRARDNAKPSTRRHSKREREEELTEAKKALRSSTKSPFKVIEDAEKSAADVVNRVAPRRSSHLSQVGYNRKDVFNSWHMSVQTLVDTLNAGFPVLLMEKIDELVLEFEDAASRLPDEQRNQPLFSISDALDIFKACARGMNILSTRQFTAAGALRRGLLNFFTSVSTIEESHSFFVDPLLEYYEEHPRVRPRKTDVSVENRTFWAVSLLYTGMSVAELYAHVKPPAGANYVSPLYTGNVNPFRSLMMRTIRHLARALEKFISFPDVEDWKRHNTGAGMEKFWQKLFFFIDGTSWPIYTPRSHVLKRALYVGYKKHHAFRYFIMCTPDGRIVFVSGVKSGRTTDCTEYDESKVREKLEELYPAEMVKSLLDEGWQLHIGGDKGYIHLRPPEHWFVTVTKSGEAELASGFAPTREDRTATCVANFTTDLCVPRAVIERRIGDMKKWGILSVGRTRFNDNLPRNEIVRLVVAVENMRAGFVE